MRFNISLSGHLLSVLSDTCVREQRTAQQQIVLFIREGLERRGYLLDAPAASVTDRSNDPHQAEEK